MEPDLFAFVMLLLPERAGPPPLAQGHGAQALFLDLVRQVDPALAAALHADARSKPFTVALLPAPRHSRGPTPVALRVSLLRADLFQPFVQALLSQLPGDRSLRLGQTRLALGDVLGTPEAHPWAGYSSFAAIAAAAQPGGTAAIEFVGATAFSQGSRPDGRTRLGLLPTPEALFGSLARRWNELAPPELRLDDNAVDAAAHETIISRYELRSTQISLGKGPQKGFVGNTFYELPTDPAQSRLISLLADAAFFLGAGMKTARGMGLCRRIGEVG